MSTQRFPMKSARNLLYTGTSSSSSSNVLREGSSTSLHYIPWAGVQIRKNGSLREFLNSEGSPKEIAERWNLLRKDCNPSTLHIGDLAWLIPKLNHAALTKADIDQKTTNFAGTSNDVIVCSNELIRREVLDDTPNGLHSSEVQIALNLLEAPLNEEDLLKALHLLVYFDPTELHPTQVITIFEKLANLGGRRIERRNPSESQKKFTHKKRAGMYLRHLTPFVELNQVSPTKALAALQDWRLTDLGKRPDSYINAARLSLLRHHMKLSHGEVAHAARRLAVLYCWPSRAMAITVGQQLEDTLGYYRCRLFLERLDSSEKLILERKEISQKSDQELEDFENGYKEKVEKLQKSLNDASAKKEDVEKEIKEIEDKAKELKDQSMEAHRLYKSALSDHYTITMVDERSTSRSLVFPNRTLFPETIGDWLMSMAMSDAHKPTVPVNFVKWAKHYMNNWHPDGEFYQKWIDEDLDKHPSVLDGKPQNDPKVAQPTTTNLTEATADEAAEETEKEAESEEGSENEASKKEAMESSGDGDFNLDDTPENSSKTESTTSPPKEEKSTKNSDGGLTPKESAGEYLREDIVLGKELSTLVQKPEVLIDYAWSLSVLVLKFSNQDNYLDKEIQEAYNIAIELLRKNYKKFEGHLSKDHQGMLDEIIFRESFEEVTRFRQSPKQGGLHRSLLRVLKEKERKKLPEVESEKPIFPGVFVDGKGYMIDDSTGLYNKSYQTTVWKKHECFGCCIPGISFGSEKTREKWMEKILEKGGIVRNMEAQKLHPRIHRFRAFIGPLEGRHEKDD